MRIFDVLNGELVRRTIGAGGQGSGRHAAALALTDIAMAATAKAKASNKFEDHKAAAQAHIRAADARIANGEPSLLHTKLASMHIAQMDQKTAANQRYFSRRLNGPGSGAAEMG